ncbi:MAG: hypothetical protein KF886_22485 [Candidatus Hydrogenedentes bacterium]|nr:hypothetical protein [Candidatus Hydrogenedentota bacterium]
MKTCTWFNRIEALIDGEAREAEAVQAHLVACPDCTAHRDQLLRLRAAVRREAPVLSDAQFPAFMDGIRQEIGQAPARPRGFWALASLAAAALVIAVATFSIFDGAAPVPVQANEVEAVSTEIDGATVVWGDSGAGVTTIWISITEDDL